MSTQLPSIHHTGPPNPYQPTTSYDSSSAPSTLSPQSPSGGRQTMGLLGPHLGPRPEADIRQPFPQPLQISTLPDAQIRYAADVEHLIVAPGQVDQFRVNRAMGGAPSVSQVHPIPPLQGHKRAYRQRRKDPSCDACRERKVKCDATDTSSCSECSSRNVKCQFTKETNRRMSSIKQVQDLEKQLLVARQQVTQLQSMVKSDGLAIEDGNSPPVYSPDTPNKRQKLMSAYDFTTVQNNMKKHSSGIVRSPALERTTSSSLSDISYTELPEQAKCDELLYHYKNAFQKSLPFLDWSSLIQSFAQAHRAKSLRGIPKETCSVMFATLACGCLCIGQRSTGNKHMDMARQSLDLWVSEPSLDLIRAIMLVALFLSETDDKSPAFAILGFAVRAAQDLGLHHRMVSRLTLDARVRYQIWWCLYSFERNLAFELGRPSMIDEDDCEVFDDIPPQPDFEELPFQFENIIRIAHLVPDLHKAFKLTVIPPATLYAIDDRIGRCLSMLHQRTQPSQSHAETQIERSGCVMYLYATRFLLHRHNFSPESPTESRIKAIENCLAAAKQTVVLLKEVFDIAKDRRNNSHNNFGDFLHFFSRSSLCLHIWRCTLILLACEDYDDALSCIRASESIGLYANVNGRAGRYVEFFLEVLAARNRREQIDLHEDDEVMAYLSGDLQNNLDQAWIWNDEMNILKDGLRDGMIEDHRGKAKELVWEDWYNLSRFVEDLRTEKIRRKPEQMLRENTSEQHQTRANHLSPKHDPSLDVPRLTTITKASNSSNQVSPSNRMSIADLI